MGGRNLPEPKSNKQTTKEASVPRSLTNNNQHSSIVLPIGRERAPASLLFHFSGSAEQQRM